MGDQLQNHPPTLTQTSFHQEQGEAHIFSMTSSLSTPAEPTKTNLIITMNFEAT
jgi:hypothetical protein